MFTTTMYLFLGLIAAQHCNKLGIVSDTSLARAMELTAGITITEEELALVAAEIQKNGLPNSVQCTAYERMLSAKAPGA